MLQRAHALVRRRRRRARLQALGALVVGVLVSGLAWGWWLSSAPYSGPVSDHFSGTRFFNPAAPRRGGVSAALQWAAHRHSGSWQPWTDAPPGPPPPRSVADGRMRITFVNHATTLLQMDGVNVLTDPIWSDRCSPVEFAGPKRVRPPGLRFEDLPPIDVVLISHSHYDHLDLPTLKRLARAHHPRFIVGLGVGRILEGAGIGPVTELDWWRGEELRAGFRITSVPTQHFANRGIADRDTTLWTGYTIAGASGTAFFAGDTGFGPQFAEIRKRAGPIRLAILPIGAYKPEWFMGPIHMSPRQALDAHNILGAGTSVAIHFGTFRLAEDGQTEAPDELRKAVAEAGDPLPRFWVLDFGEGREVPPLNEK